MKTSPLVKRCFTALVLVPLVILGVLTLSPLAFAVVVSLIMLLAAWEWTRLMLLEKLSHRLLYLLLLVLILLLIEHFYFPLKLVVFGHTSSLLKFVLATALIWWFIAFIVVLLYAYRPISITHYKIYLLLSGLIGLFILLQFVLGMVTVQIYGVTLYLLFLIWFVDSAAYVVGRKWGRKKLLPAVSPGKTRMGLYGGVCFGIIIALIAAWFFNIFHSWNLKWWLIWSVLTILVSMVGDLFISVMKRQCHLKDSGSLLPGHGGVLDRLDSLLAAAPIFAYYCAVYLSHYYR